MTDRFVYFIRPIGMTSPIKIGCSEVPQHRLETLMAWSPLPLEVVATIPGKFDLERNIHECLADLHSHREWFNDDGRIAVIIDKLKAGTPIGEAMDLTARVRPMGKKAAHWTKNPEGRLRCSYVMRVNGAIKRAEKALGYSVGEPTAVNDIIARWRGYGWIDDAHYRAERITPTPEEMATLDAYLADPASYYAAPTPMQRAA
jgi:hypothetical protein